MPIHRLLIANRGEIALRVVRACRDLGIRSLAIYSEPDRTATHVRLADEAYALGPAAPSESYLNIPRVLELARRVGADAIHPGYGFLSENPEFAHACTEAGLIFVGPLAETIRLLGNKAEARRVMRGAGIPVVPGSELLSSPQEALALAKGIGYPVMVKAAAGGGGRGIRMVERAEDFAAAVETAQAEARQAFGDGSVYLEKYLSPVRHVEVQILADNYGNVVSLGERECSIQRRHQKVIEEAPSPAVDAALRKRLMEAGVAAAKVTSYRGAGTVEFLLDTAGNPHFLEVNTRLQVEHPITELITGVDLVRDQLLLASGEPLPYRQEDITFRGWAMECRVAAEDPFQGFMPAVGTIAALIEPGGPWVRVDSSLYPGQEITPHYDSLLSKVITWGRDRPEVIGRMQRALTEYTIAGVSTNLPFLTKMLAHDDFRAGRLSTGLTQQVVEHLTELEPQRVELLAIAAAVAAQQNGSAQATTVLPGASGGPSPWVLSYRPQAGARGPWRQGG